MGSSGVFIGDGNAALGIMRSGWLTTDAVEG
jgi:hypothetical protein